MRAAKIRKTFLDYFTAVGHTHIESASLVPVDDPTLLFINSGMAPFKDVFLGREKRPYSRAVTAQKCVRAGGKHNDLENVGYTARHHTFFEMLGNFSFGDYFKEEAIVYAWKLLTDEIGLSPQKLWVTVHLSDDAAATIWRKKIGVPTERIIRLEENFWNMGDTGPCGPCSEIFYDYGPKIAGGPPGSPDENEGERFIEIWNLVFMQYERFSDGNMEKLPKPSVDTGMGLERMSALMQGVHNNYETDLFLPLIEGARTMAAATTPPKQQSLASLRVIADHMRASAFLIADGVLPANEGRGYVLRRIIRRGLRHADKLGIKYPCFPRLLPHLIDVMGEPYPTLISAKQHIISTLEEEELQFSRTLKTGMELLSNAIAKVAGSANTLSGETIFKLYDTYGFPPDLTADVAREHSLAADWEGFEKEMTEQRKRSRAYGVFSLRQQTIPKNIQPTTFVGYTQTETTADLVSILDADGKSINSLKVGETGTLILDKTSFYAESGGQIGDTGRIVSHNSLFQVTDTQKQDGVFLHFGKVEEGKLNLDDALTVTVDAERRAEIRLHHTATHLLHAALHQVLGEHAQQRGSLVTDSRLRLDFANKSPLDTTTITEIENWVNEKIARTMPITTREMPLKDAKKAGAAALFGEKYGEVVRVLAIEDKKETASIELCGGTHATNTGELGFFCIESEEGIAAGIRRLEAQTGAAAVQTNRNRRQILKKLGALLSAKGDQHIVADISSLRKKLASVEKELHHLRAEVALKELQSAYANAIPAGKTRLLVFCGHELPQPSFMHLVDDCRAKFATGLAILLNEKQDKDTVAVTVLSGNKKNAYPADELLNHLITEFGGGGGGSAQKAKGGIRRRTNRQMKYTEAIKMSSIAWITAKTDSPSH